MQRAFGIVTPSEVEAATQPESIRGEARLSIPRQRLNLSLRDLSTRYAALRMTVALFRRRKCLVETRLATIGRVGMDDPALRRLIDR